MTAKPKNFSLLKTTRITNLDFSP